MANKIDSNTPPHLHVSGHGASGKARGDAVQPAGNAPAAPVSGGDTVNLTDSARQLAALEAAVASASEVDQARVDAIRARIDSGDYRVSPEQIADKLLRFDQALPEAR